MKKRVLQFIGSFHQGGSERQAVGLTRLLNDDGTFEVLAATMNKEGVLLGEIESLAMGDIPEFQLISFFDANFVRQVRSCARYLKDNRIDLVHTHDFYTNVFGMTAASLAGVKARVASKRETGEMRSAAQEFVEKVAFGRARAIVVNSEAVREYLARRSVPKGKIHVIYNGIDIERFDVLEDRSAKIDRLGFPPGKRIVTLVANLRHRVKNVPMLLRAAKRISDVLQDVDFVIAGEGELVSELKSLSGELGVAERTHFLGRCTDIPALLSASYACVLTSTAEGFSNSILEYMAAGKPVVATNVGGAREAIVEGETGYLVASDDALGMAERLIELLNDQSKAIEFGEKGRRVVSERFSTSAQLNSTVQLYNSLF